MSLRREREIDYLSAVQAVEAFSVIAKADHSDSLAEFFRSKGLRVTVVDNVIGGDEPRNDIQVEKTIEFTEFNQLLNEWKANYAADEG